MNIHADVVFANQGCTTEYKEHLFDGHCARMITTETRGVGNNRNLALMYAQGEICLFADDDVVYDDDMQERILAEFDAHPDADIMIFHLDEGGDPERKQISYSRTHKCRGLFRMPWGAVRVAFRLNAVRKANVWFTTLFGGGCIFPAGEDSMWLAEAKRKHLTFYVSKETIGKVSFAESTWFTGYDEKYFFGIGAFYQAARPRTVWIWLVYTLFRTRGLGYLTVNKKISMFIHGRGGYRKMVSYEQWKQSVLVR